MGQVGFEQHLDFILLLKLSFPVVERRRSRQDGGAGGEFFPEHFGRQILGSRFIRRGSEINNSIRRSHREPGSSEKRPYSVDDAGRLTKGASYFTGPFLTILQHEAAEDESEDHAKRNGDDARDQEGVVKDIFADTRGAGVVHFNRGQQGRIGWQHEQR